MIIFTVLVYRIAVLLFTGNMVTGLLWKIMADRSGDRCIISHTFRGIFYSDRVFTAPCLIIIAALNFVINKGKIIPYTLVNMHLALFVSLLWGLVIFIFIVHPLRKALYLIAREGCEGGSFDAARYKKLSARWAAWGLLESFPLISLLVLSI